MTPRLSYQLCLLMVVILSAAHMAGCSGPSLTTTMIATKTMVPIATATLTSEVSSTEIISVQNISQVELIDSRELGDKPKEFLPRSMDFAADGSLLVADEDETVYVWNGFTGQQTNTFDHSQYLWHVVISQNGKLVASGGESGIIKIWDLKTGTEVNTLVHPGTIQSLAFSPDSKILVSGSLTLENIRFWDLSSGEIVYEIDDVHQDSLVFSPDGRMVAIGLPEEIILWDVNSQKEIKRLNFDLRGGEGLSGIQGALFSPDGTMIAAANADNIAMVWDLVSGKKLSTILGTGTFLRMSEGTLAFSPDGKILATGNDNGDVIFWDMLTDKELHRIGSQDCIPLDLMFGVGGNVFEIACQNGTIQF